MSLGELLRTKSGEYKLLAEWHDERGPLDAEHLVACQTMAVVGIVLRDVAEAIRESGGEDGWGVNGVRAGQAPNVGREDAGQA